jgi:HSP20 family molecular chaperone IbpA
LNFDAAAPIQLKMDTYRRKSWMWAEACALLEEAERKHRHFFDLLGAPATRPVWEPPADIFADGSQLNVVIALPGARADEVTVQITPTGLLIDTTVPPPAVGAMNVVRLEIPYGRMRRRIDLPPGRYALVERRLDHGCLHLRLSREAA